MLVNLCLNVGAATLADVLLYITAAIFLKKLVRIATACRTAQSCLALFFCKYQHRHRCLLQWSSGCIRSFCHHSRPKTRPRVLFISNWSAAICCAHPSQVETFDDIVQLYTHLPYRKQAYII